MASSENRFIDFKLSANSDTLWVENEQLCSRLPVEPGWILCLQGKEYVVDSMEKPFEDEYGDIITYAYVTKQNTTFWADLTAKLTINNI